jgi:NADH:ubiquinone oxidoreductase 27 kD subunit
VSDKEVQEIVEIELSRLLAAVDSLRSADWRLVQILCIAQDGANEISYSFGKELAMRSLRVKVAAEESLPSITALYPAAFLYENEIRDLFGAKIERIAADWQGKVYDVAGETPFKKVSVKPQSSEGGSK